MHDSLTGIVGFIFVIALYAYGAYSIQLLANKTNTPNAWMAWVPIINMFLLLKIAGKPGWWFILFLVPLVNIVIIAMVWMAVATAVGKANWLGILMLVPLVNFIVLGYLAFAETPQIPSPQNQITGM